MKAKWKNENKVSISLEISITEAGILEDALAEKAARSSDLLRESKFMLEELLEIFDDKRSAEERIEKAKEKLEPGTSNYIW